MNKKILGLAGALGLGAIAITEVAVHGYLDVMYKETIPQGVFKRKFLNPDDPSKVAFHNHIEKSCEWIEEQDIEYIDLESSRGYTLKGYYLPAENESKKFAVLSHGYRSNHFGDPANFVKYYHENGYNVLAVDHTASGASGGDYVGFDYFESEDLLLWVDYLIGRFNEDIRIVLHGVSMGAATVCKCSSKVQSQVKAIISDCAYTGAKQQFTSVVESVGIKKTTPILVKTFNALNKAFAGYDLRDTDVLHDLKNSKVPMLFVHGADDDFVPTDMVFELYQACGKEKELLVIEGAKHAQSYMTDKETYDAKMTEFLGKYM